MVSKQKVIIANKSTKHTHTHSLQVTLRFKGVKNTIYVIFKTKKKQTRKTEETEANVGTKELFEKKTLTFKHCDNR